MSLPGVTGPRQVPDAEFQASMMPAGRPALPVATGLRLRSADRDYGIQILTRSEGVMFLRVRVERAAAGSR